MIPLEGGDIQELHRGKYGGWKRAEAGGPTAACHGVHGKSLSTLRCRRVFLPVFGM
jgi:hypothetical protein